MTNAGNEQGIFEETTDAFAQEDIDLFFAKFAPYVPQGTTPQVDSIDGGVAPVPVHSEYNGGESDLDIDLSYSIIYPQTVIIYETDDYWSAEHKDGFLNTFLDAVDGSYCNYTAYGITGDSPIGSYPIAFKSE